MKGKVHDEFAGQRPPERLSCATYFQGTENGQFDFWRGHGGERSVEPLRGREVTPSTRRVLALQLDAGRRFGLRTVRGRLEFIEWSKA